MSTELSPAVLAELGLERQPFNPVARAEIFVDAGMQTLIERLLHNLTYGDMLLLLLGPPGSGKTALVLALLDHLPGRLELFIAKGQAGLSCERIVRDMLATYRSGQAADFDAAFSSLHEHLAATARRDIPAALVIDDADQIETRQLEKLLELIETLNQALDAPLRIMLVGGPQLEAGLARLRSRALREGRVFATQVRPLSNEQAIAFIAHRLHAAGAKREPPISDSHWERIYVDSGGLPGPLQTTLAQHLNQRYAGSAKQPVAAAPRHFSIWPIAVAVALILTLLTVWLLPGAPPETADIDQVELKLPPRPSLRATLNEPDPAPERNATPRPSRADAAGAPTPAATAPAVVTAPTDRPLPVPSAASAGPIEPPPPTTRAEVRPAETRANRPEAPPAGGTDAETTPAPPPPAPAAPATSPPAEAATVAATPAGGLLSDDWLSAQAAETFTLQLLALGDRRTIEAFAERYRYTRETPAAWFRTTHRGGDWFVLIAGVYPDKASARRALNRLPAAVRRNGPWIRSFASIQAALPDAER